MTHGTRFMIQDNEHMIAVAKRIKKHEGFRVNVYDDHLGNKTGGYGHLMLDGETEPEGGYTKEYWEGVFQKDFVWYVSDRLDGSVRPFFSGMTV